ncbi:MAG: polysaccharide deacetylase family protein [Ignavibacteriaceae bacterium]|nr:polysaccharide deacetylase family protein [Ignavibacteriaceae bacterium]
MNHNIKNTAQTKIVIGLFYLLFGLILFSTGDRTFSQENPAKRVLILTEGNTDLKSFAFADGRQLAQLMGHFNTKTTLKGVNQYSKNELNNFDFIFYIGYKLKDKVPDFFLNDVLSTTKPVTWMYTGFLEFSKSYNLKKIFGFTVTEYDSTAGFDIVKSNGKTFTKGDVHTSIINISDKKGVQILATAYSTKKKKETPYIVKSKNLIYVADSPFAYADENDRYLLFADMLHDILGEYHKDSHSALIRIEDVSPMDNPDKLRDIADLLSEKGIPFLVGVIPFYVDPGAGVRISLSDKPDLVDALKYIVKNGGTIVMHGITHQYKGITASDFEFWDESTNKPIKDETEASISRKIELGIQEFMKNGLYPMIWETPHYTASFQLYKTISKYFSTAMEQRLAIEDYDHSQYFPYIINQDLFGQKIIPENLGYVPYDQNNKSVSQKAVQDILKGAKTNLYVRDGFASCFFHDFLDLDLLKELVEGITALGYTYIDLRDETNWVKLKDKVMLTGSQSYTVNLDDQYLVEAYYSHNGEIKEKIYSDKRLKGLVTKYVELKPGEFYRAETTEYKEHELTFFEKISNHAQRLYKNLFAPNEDWNIARPVILWNHFSKGGAYNDQASFASVFKSVNINVDTIFLGENLDLKKYNLLIIPYAIVDSLPDKDFDVISAFIQNGGNIITDTKNEIATELGLKFTQNNLRVIKLREKFFPEEKISWRYAELVNKIEIEPRDEVFSMDEITGIPMVIGRQIGKGKLLFFNSRFDPYSRLGYSLYPYLMDYVKRYLNLRPLVRKDNLEVFFDPGFRHTYSIENLIKQWVNQGIRIIHVAGWHDYPTWTYDYKRLINLAHANGILVYAWLEPPQVSLKFWQEHPQWREKNYKNEDVRPSWRYPMALTDDSCLATMNYEFGKFLNSYDWDGVNLAELYFEAAKGLEDPKYFTPMHRSARSEVMKLYGIDLFKIFDPSSSSYWKYNDDIKNKIIQYRIKKLESVYDLFLNTFTKIAKKKNGFEVIVTALDSYGSPELKEYIAADMSNIIQLQKKYGFSLNVEDPENLWSTDPMRYVEMGKFYSSLIGSNSKLMLDLNILNFRKDNVITPFPTLIQTGTESFHLINAVSTGAPRSVIYSEASVNAQDLAFFPYAASVGVEYKVLDNGYEFNSPYSFEIKLPLNIKEIRIDGNPIAPLRDNRYSIPAGRHIVTVSDVAVTSFSTHELQAKILSFTGNLISVAYGMKDIKFYYDSQVRTLLSLNRNPTWVKVDHQDFKFDIMEGNDCFSIFLPTGSHFVEIGVGNSFSYGINLTSLWSSTGIAIFGTLAVTLLVCMYLILKIIRRKYSTI